MLKNPWVMLLLGLLIGFAVGFVVGEGQTIRPAAAVATPGSGQDAMPEGHPPVPAASGGQSGQQVVERRIAELEALLTERPDDARLMVGLGNMHYDSSNWPEARRWYERALEITPNEPDVMTDLAVVYRNLEEPERSIALLDRVIELQPDHWQAWHNKAVVLHFDLGRSREAAEALERLRAIAATNPEVPDLSALERQVRGG